MGSIYYAGITELLKVGSVVQCPCPPVVVNPLSVSIQPNGKKRLILDLRHVNFFVQKSKIKFEDAKSFLECLVASPCAWACSFDIKSGYHHIEIFESDQQFLGFSWVFDGVTKYFKVTVLPFGLSVGPYSFSKVMRSLVKYWRSIRPLELLFISTTVFLRPQIFPNAKGILCLSGQIFSSLALLPTKISVSGFPFRSFVGWVFFGISKTTVCLYHRRRFQGSSKKLLKLCPFVAFLQENLLVLQGELYPIF